MSHRLLSIDDLDDGLLEEVLERAMTWAVDEQVSRHRRFQVGTMFLEPSLRTRTGFAAAAHRLGWPTPLEAIDRRASEISMPESMHDTVAVLGAYVDLLVLRVTGPVRSVVDALPDHVHVINAGDRGPAAEHPSQALIDLVAMQQLVGPVEDLHVALVGDLRMRSARSLLGLLARRHPARLTLVTDPALTDGLVLPELLRGSTVVDHLDDAVAVDALHVVGIPHGGAEEQVRTRLRVTVSSLHTLTARGRVFSPMPVIDEIAQNIRTDDSMAFLRQSALGLPVRMALLNTLTR